MRPTIALRITARFLLIVCLAIARCIYTAIEQPASSMMTHLHLVQDIADFCTHTLGIPWNKVSLWGPQRAGLFVLCAPSPMGAYGAPTLKPTKVFGTALGSQSSDVRPALPEAVASSAAAEIDGSRQTPASDEEGGARTTLYCEGWHKKSAQTSGLAYANVLQQLKVGAQM